MLNSGNRLYPAAFPCPADSYLLRNAFFQLFAVTYYAYEFAASRQIEQYIHCAFNGLAVERTEAFVYKQSIHLNASEAG